MQSHPCRLIAVLILVFSMALATSADEPKPTATPAVTATPSATPAPSAAPAATQPSPAPVAQAPAGMDEPKPNRVYVDEDFDLKVHVPEGWYRTNPANYGSAGQLLRVWTPGNVTAIMVYRVDAQEPYIPLTLLDQTAESMTTRRHAIVLEQEVRTIAGKQAAWLVVSGPGNGGAIEGQGVIPTVQHMVAVPRATDTVVFNLATPESDYPQYRPVFEKMIESLEVGGEQTEAQKASS